MSEMQGKYREKLNEMWPGLAKVLKLHQNVCERGREERREREKVKKGERRMRERKARERKEREVWHCCGQLHVFRVSGYGHAVCPPHSQRATVRARERESCRVMCTSMASVITIVCVFVCVCANSVAGQCSFINVPGISDLILGGKQKG